jgi:hypothetical protein
MFPKDRFVAVFEFDSDLPANPSPAMFNGPAAVTVD